MKTVGTIAVLCLAAGLPGGVSGRGVAVSPGDLRAAELQTRVLGVLAIPWAEVGGVPASSPGSTDRIEPLTPLDWLLLSREAREAVREISTQECDKLLTRSGLSLDRVKLLAEGAGATMAVARAAAANYLGIRAYYDQEIAATEIPEDELKQWIRDTRNQVTVKVLLLNWATAVDRNEPVEEDELGELFDQYRDSYPEQNREGIGYRWPWRIAAEYLWVKLDEVRPSVTVSEEQARACWSEDKTRFLDKPFEEVEAEVVERALLVEAVHRVDAAVEVGLKELAKPWETAASGSGRTKVAPEEVEREGYMKEMARRLSESTGVPFHYRSTGLLAPGRDYPDQPLWSAFRDAPNERRMVFKYYAFHVQGFPRWPVPHARHFHLDLYEPAPEAAFDMRLGDPWDRFLYRIVEVRPGESPKDLSEVRQDVARDVRLLRASKRVREIAEKCRQMAGEKGLSAAEHWLSAADRGVTWRMVGAKSFSRRVAASVEAAGSTGSTSSVPTVPTIGEDQLFIDRCFDLIEIPAEKGDGETTHRRLAVMRLPHLKEWAVIELVEHRHVAGDWTRALENARPIFRAARKYNARRTWFDPAEIRRRTGYETQAGVNPG